MTNRRKFLINTSSLIMAAGVLPLVGCSNMSAKTNIGVQIYSVRDALGEDFQGTMEKIANIGYKHIEAYDLGVNGSIFGMTPAKYRQVVEDLGMSLISTHSTYFTPDQAPAMLDAAQEAGLQYVVVPWIGDDLRMDYAAVADNLNRVGEVFKGSGIQLGYHNHDFEFQLQNGKLGLEILLQNTDPELVTFQADLYWVTRGGMDPMELIRKYPGRFSSFHIKDSDTALEQTTVGTGIIDFESILKEKQLSGWEYYFVEDERTDDPFGNLQDAFDYLNAADFV